MEAIECQHAEHVKGPLLFAAFAELRDGVRVADVGGLPRLQSSSYADESPLLWISGVDALSDEEVLVPYELVHLDHRFPRPAGSGAFLSSSNGLASGNGLIEAISHGICEVVERDANTLWYCRDDGARRATRTTLQSIDDPLCLALLERFDRAGLDIGVWETTSDVGLASFFATVVDRDPYLLRPMPPVSGSGCHPRRAIALARALTEAAQGRLTIIAGARDDLSFESFDGDDARRRGALERERIARESGSRSFRDAPDATFETLEEDVRHELRCLSRASISQVIIVNLTSRELAIPVVRVVVPYLEAMGEVPGYVPGPRAQAVLRRRVS
jgi:ribosomal protein S12 methylthiotransferase accessory factor